MSVVAWKSVDVDGNVKFKVPSNWQFMKKVGAGAYGTVAAFQDTHTLQQVAVKKITNAFSDLLDGKRILREVKLLRTMKHDNIVQILDLYPPDHPDFDDIYIVQDLMETDLHRVIQSRQALLEEHRQYISYQILRGLLYLHSADVVHRDLKPANILVNKNCDAKICDFGLARGFGGGGLHLTDYVVTRWYRAPEVVLHASQYTKSIDIWAVGCILCEMIGRKPVFPGSHYLEQIKTITKIIGTPSETDLDWLPENSPAFKFLAKLPTFSKRPWHTIYPEATADGIEAIERMITFHPVRRATVQEAIDLPYYHDIHMPDDEPTADHPVDWAFDDFTPTKRLLQNHLYLECAAFHPDIIARDEELFAARGIDKLLPQ